MRCPFECDAGRPQWELFGPGVRNTHWENLPPFVSDSIRQAHWGRHLSQGELPPCSCLYVSERP